MPVGAVIEDIHLSYVLMSKGYVTRYLNEIPVEWHGFRDPGRVRRATGALGAGVCPGPAAAVRAAREERIEPMAEDFLSVDHYVLDQSGFCTDLCGGAADVLVVRGVAIHRRPRGSGSVSGALFDRQPGVPDLGGARPIIPWVWEAVQIVFALDVTRSVFPMLATGRVNTTRTTRKGLEIHRTSVNWRLMGHIVVLAALNVAGLCWGQSESVRETASRTADQVNIFWSINALVILGVAAMLCVERPRRRLEQRFAIDEPVRLTNGTQAVLEEVSVSGMRLRMLGAPSLIAFSGGTYRWSWHGKSGPIRIRRCIGSTDRRNSSER